MDGSRWNEGRRGARLEIVLLAGALAVTAGCAAARMVPPNDVAEGSDAFEAEGRSSMSGAWVDESFRLGPYAVAGVDRSWDSGQAVTHGAYTRNDVQSGYVYQFREGAEALLGSCTAQVAESSYALTKSFSSLSKAYRLTCTCGSGDRAASLELAREEGKPEGRVTLARGAVEVKSVHATNGLGTFHPAGYRLGNPGEAPLGAVEVLHPGRIWLSRSLEAGERRQLGCLMAGLMLWSEPSES